MTHKDTYSIENLLKVMQTLRAPDGCPWDAKQTPESLTPYILEEACELIDAIDDGKPELILDELGDLLLQVVFLAQLFDEQQKFDFYDVAKSITDKLVRRHPHVFTLEDAERSEAELSRQWDQIKRSEINNNKTCLADHLPERLPTLQRAQKLTARAHRVDRQTELPALNRQLLQTLFCSTNLDTKLQIDEETLGQALFHLVGLAHDAGLEAEVALRKMTRKTIKELDAE